MRYISFHCDLLIGTLLLFITLPALSNSIVPVGDFHDGGADTHQQGHDYTLTCTGFTIPENSNNKGQIGCCATVTPAVYGNQFPQCNFVTSQTSVGRKFDTSTGTVGFWSSPDENDPNFYYLDQKVCAKWMTSTSSQPTMGSWYELTGSGVPSSSCITPPPPPGAVVCTAQSFTIDHQDVSPSSFNGSEASGVGTVKCTGGSASVKLYFSSPTISFSNGGKSSLTFSNGSTSEIVNATENVSTSFTVKSHLSSSGAVKTGAFSGSTTIITDIQ